MRTYVKYLITIGVGLLFTFFVLQMRDLWSQTETKQIIRFLSDGFSITGIFFVSFGALCFCSAQGAFYGVSYMFHILFSTHNWSPKTPFKEKMKYADYVEEKKGKAKPVPAYILIVGAGFFLIGIIFMIIFNYM